MDTVVSIAQVFATIFVAVALIFSWRQAKVMEESFNDLQESRARQQFYEAHKYLDEIRPEIEDVLSLEGKDFSQWSEHDLESAYKVCAHLHLVGILVLENHVPEKLLAHAWYYSIPKCSSILKPYLSQIRQERGKTYWSAIDILAMRVAKHAEEFSGFQQ